VDDATFHVGERSLGGSQEEGALQPDTLERLADYAWFEGRDIGCDVG
jgi:hypothetical protein